MCLNTLNYYRNLENMLCILKKPSVSSIIKINGIHSSSINSASPRQIGNAMKKVLGGSKKKTHYFCETPKMPTADAFSKGSFEGKGSINSRRGTVLNKLFMRHISDQMAAGECSQMVFGHGLEINRVKVTPDYKFLRVYWTAKSEAEYNNDIENILQRCAGILRHELSQLRLIGNVPVIKFIKDKHAANLVELDSRLVSADYGPDHVPLNVTDKLKTQLEISLPLGEDIKEKLKEIDNIESEHFEDVPLPPMTQNVFGICHSKIMDRIKISVKKSKASHRTEEIKQLEGNQDGVVNTFNENPLYLGDAKAQRAAFREFLQKREILRAKAKRDNRRDQPELIDLDEVDEVEMNNKPDWDFEDYIYEDIDEKS